MKLPIRSGLLFALIFSPLLFAGQEVIQDYESAQRDFFWSQLYTGSGDSLYCSIPFSRGGNFTNEAGVDKRMTIEHAYPADWMADHFGCESRDTCEGEQYKFAEADLHNLWPAHGRINSSRGKTKFGELADSSDYHRFKSFCSDYERRPKKGNVEPLVEPQDLVKGDIARSLLYMSDIYGFDLFDMKPMLLKWHKEDPVSSPEQWRNKVINSIQGTQNHWISAPE